MALVSAGEQFLTKAAMQSHHLDKDNTPLHFSHLLSPTSSQDTPS